MRLRSFDDLDFELAWARVLSWVRDSTQLSVPDRLPFEVLARIYDDVAPPIRREHHLAPVTLVVSSKKSGTARPFVRASPRDVLLYQALVDDLASDIENALPPRDVVFAYRQDLAGSTSA